MEPKRSLGSVTWNTRNRGLHRKCVTGEGPISTNRLAGPRFSETFTGNRNESNGSDFQGKTGTGTLYRSEDCLENCTARAPILHSACCDRQWCFSRQNPLYISSLVRGIHGEQQRKVVGVQCTEFGVVVVRGTSCKSPWCFFFPSVCSTVREKATKAGHKDVQPHAACTAPTQSYRLGRRVVSPGCKQ